MLLNARQKENFKEVYPKTSMPDLIKYYGSNNRSIINMAKLLGVYESKTGKYSKERNRK